MLLNLIMLLNMSLLVTHELDAMRAKEWKMLPWLQKLPSNKAQNCFIVLHIPLAVLVFSLWQYGGRIGPMILDLALIGHLAAHLIFIKHPQNKFVEPLSRYLIYCMGVLGALHLMLLLAGGL